MKKSILFFVSALAVGISACQTPDVLVSSREGTGINSIIASFPGDGSMDNKFSGEIDYDNGIITMVFPYNYPAGSDVVVTEDMLRNVRMAANLENNVIIKPALLFMDLTQPNSITVTDNSARTEKVYQLKAEIRKSAECSLSQFNISSLSLTGVINDKDKTVSFISVENIGTMKLAQSDIIISHGATISPDPRETAVDFDQPQEITVIAQNGTDKTTYKVSKSVPAKTKLGIRPNSGTMLWVKRVDEIEGINKASKVTGIAVTDDWIVLNERGNSSAVYLNNKTGEKAGTMDISEFASDNGNFYATADRDGNILFSSYCSTVGVNTFRVWKAATVNDKPSKFIEYATNGFRTGWQLSVQGSIDSNAILTSVMFDVSPVKFLRWQVKDGSLVSQTPDRPAACADIPSSGVGRWGDAVYASATDLNSDIFFNCYSKYSVDSKRYMYMLASDGSVKSKTPGDNTSNTPEVAVDFAVFNGASYVVHNLVNVFTYAVATSDLVNMFDVTGGSFLEPITICEPKIYGAVYNTGAVPSADGYSTGDVAIKVAPNGYFMYVYFLFSNGCVGCMRFDCLDI